MENDGFWVHWFSSGSALWKGWLSCPSTAAVQGKHRLGQGMQGKDEPYSSWSPAAQVQIELNSKPKENLARSVAPSHHLRTTRATNTSSSSRGFTESSMEPEYRASGPPILFLRNILKTLTNLIYWKYFVFSCTVKYTAAWNLYQSFTSFVIPTSTLKLIKHLK